MSCSNTFDVENRVLKTIRNKAQEREIRRTKKSAKHKRTSIWTKLDLLLADRKVWTRGLRARRIGRRKWELCRNMPQLRTA